ncbi:MAG: hypothetical protein Q4P66_05235 [Actinomycetaceae bacterium]|nr:hypothetical protein [Actinomycetaceae bacterium]
MLDPHLTASQLQKLAVERPELHEEILSHPQCYPDLAVWIRNYSATVMSQSAAPHTSYSAQPKPAERKVKKQKKSRGNRIVTILVAAVVVFALVGTALWGWVFYMKHQAAYAYGVMITNEHSVPDGAAVLASASKGDTVYSLVIKTTKDSVESYVMETKHGKIKSALKAKLSTPLKEVMTDPSHTLCNEVDGLTCKPSKRKKASESKEGEAPAKVTLQANMELTWDDEEEQWVGKNATYDSNLIFGHVDDFIIGTQTCGRYAGRTDTAAIPTDSITAYSIATGKPVWSQELQAPGYVAISDNTIVVTDAAAVSDTPDVQVTEDTNDEEIAELATSLIDNSQHSHVYELAPAQKNKATSIAPSTTKEPAGPQVAVDAIKELDFANLYLPYPGQENATTSEETKGCPAEYWNDDRFAPNNGLYYVHRFQKMPAGQGDPCWLELRNGESLERKRWGDTRTIQIGWVSKIDAHWGEEDVKGLSATGDVNDTWAIGYQDINHDGFLDAVIGGGLGEVGATYVAILDPEDPEHPFMSLLWGTQFESMGFTEEGIFEAVALQKCVSGRIVIEGMPPKITSYEAGKPENEYCIDPQ